MILLLLCFTFSGGELKRDHLSGALVSLFAVNPCRLNVF